MTKSSPGFDETPTKACFETIPTRTHGIRLSRSFLGMVGIASSMELVGLVELAD